jgi:hypothetical protein
LATTHHTPGAAHRRRLTLLRLSALGFAALIGVLAIGYFLLAGALASHMQAISFSGAPSFSDVRFLVLSLALPAMPGAALSWWLLVVLPRHSSALAGALAGLLTVVLAPLEVGVAGFGYGGFSTAALTPWQVIGWTLVIWYFGVAILCATPTGWGILLVGASAGVLYGALVRHWTGTAPEPYMRSIHAVVAWMFTPKR